MSSSGAQDKLSKAKKAALRLLKFRERSEKEIIDRLIQKKFSKDIIIQTIKYLKGAQLIDDRQFIKSRIRIHLAKPFGLRRISFELRKKGVDRQLLQEELAQIKNNYPEETIVTSLAKRRIARYRNIDQEKAKQRTYRYLIYRGFSPDVVQNVLEKL